jgi:hypothetical protein
VLKNPGMNFAPKKFAEENQWGSHKIGTDFI